MYITEHNFKRMIRKIDPRTLELNVQLFKDEVSFLTKKELEQLKLIKLISEKPEILEDSAYQFVDADTLVLNGTTPAYHKDSNCERLNSSFEAIPIPESLKEAGREQEVRIWFKENSYLLEQEKFDVLAMRFHLRFRVTLTTEVYENSGSVELINDSIDGVVQLIKDLLERSESFGKTAVEQKMIRVFAPIHYITKNQNFKSTHYDTNSVVKIINEFNKEIRYPLIKLVSKYFIMKYNSNLTYSRGILDQLGFVSCRCCKG
jgi:hypothetical protein|tara:strand:+ start:3536 stop:4318 length:783 start_codon:yes stop_codon:yes gene_type:complete